MVYSKGRLTIFIRKCKDSCYRIYHFRIDHISLQFGKYWMFFSVAPF